VGRDRARGLPFIVIEKFYIFVDVRRGGREREREKRGWRAGAAIVGECVSRAWFLVLIKLRGETWSFILGIARDGREQQIVFSRGNSSSFPQESKL
jgi:hypothetical protein